MSVNFYTGSNQITVKNTLTDELKTSYDEAVELVNKLGADATVEGSVAQRLAAIVADAPERYDTLKEIATWIESDTDGAAKMQSDISTLEADKLDKTDIATWAKASTKPNYTASEVNLANGTSVESAISTLTSNALFKSNAPGYYGDNTTSYPSKNGEIVNKEFLSYWNGSYSSGASNLAYCNQGQFGSMCTKDANNYPTTETTNSLQNQINTINGKLQTVNITYYESKTAYATVPNGTWLITNSHPYGNGLSIYVMLMFGSDLSRCEIYPIKKDPYLTISIESANYVKFQLTMVDDNLGNFRWMNIQKIGN